MAVSVEWTESCHIIWNTVIYSAFIALTKYIHNPLLFRLEFIMAFFHGKINVSNCGDETSVSGTTELVT
jgi:hypothetical protein